MPLHMNPFDISQGNPVMFKSNQILLSLLLTLCVVPVFAEGEGQEDLDKATEIKLTATAVRDLGEVIRLTEIAIKKGLDAANAEFANKLLASTYIQRAQETIKQIFTDISSPDIFRKRRQDALSDLEKAVKLDPKQPQAYLLIAQLNMLPGGTGVEEVRKALDKAIELGADAPASQAKALMLRASLQEQPEKKLADFDEAVRLMPDNVTTVRARGLMLADLGKLEPALADLDKAVELAPKDGPAHEARAIVLAQLKRYDEALVALDKAQKLNPDSVAPLLQRARIHSQQENFDAALEDLNQAMTISPSNLAVLLLRAGVYQAKGEKEKALADVDEALKLKPDLPLTIRTRALLLAENERFEEAISELEKLKKLDPKDTLTLLQLGMLYSVEKKMNEAIEIYTALLAEEPEEWRALRGRGDVYLNLGRQAEAVADYREALKLQPKDEGILNNLAWVLATSPDEKIRDGRRAIQLATEACEITEYKLPHMLSTLAAAYAETGDFDNAVKWSSKAVEIGSKEHGEAIKKELESYKAKKPWRELLSEEDSTQKKASEVEE